MRSVVGLPDLLTVEEAAAVLRIGRTKAYDLAREWRATDGASGLPVLDLGNVLRVPRHALEDMVGGPVQPADRSRSTEPRPRTTPARPSPRTKRHLVHAAEPEPASSTSSTCSTRPTRS